MKKSEVLRNKIEVVETMEQIYERIERDMIMNCYVEVEDGEEAESVELTDPYTGELKQYRLYGWATENTVKAYKEVLNMIDKYISKA